VKKHVQSTLDGVRGFAMSGGSTIVQRFFGAPALLRIARTCITTFALALGLIAGAHAAGASYVYDELGRLIQVIAADGTSTQYTYDAAGNILAVRADATTTLAITAFYPETGAAASTVTITGSGFSAVATNNTVQFNGVAASVTAATATQLTVTVPAGATTGTISVTDANGTVTSTRVFTVGVGNTPVIASFTPNLGNPGATVTITGQNFQTTPSDNLVAFNTGNVATIATASVTSLATSVPSAGASGKLTVSTVYGTATSTADFLAVPSTLSPASVLTWTRGTIGGVANALNINVAQDTGAILFDGALNQLVFVDTTGSTFLPAGSAVTYEVYGPQGTRVATGTVSAALPIAYLPPLTAAGTYAIFFEPGSATANINVALKTDASFAIDGGRYEVQGLFGGSTASIPFTGTAGQNLGTALSGLTFVGNSATAAAVTLQVVAPSGSVWLSNANCLVSNPGAGCDLNLTNLPASGTYTLQVINPTGNPPISAGTVTLSSDKTTTLTTGAAYGLNVRSGQNGRLSFAGTVGQQATVWIGSLSTAPIGVNVPVTVFAPDGTTTVGTVTLSPSVDGTFLNFASLPSTGTYTVFVDPAFGAASGMQVMLNPVATPVTIDGAAVNIANTTAGYGTFAGTAGKNLGVGLNGLVFNGGAGGSVTMQVVQPNGTVWLQTTCSTSNPGGGCDLNLSNLPTTGAYRIQLVNNTSIITTAMVTLSNDTVSALTAGTTASVSVRTGQNGRLTFAGTAGQAATLWLGNVVTTPSGLNVVATVLNPDGTTLTQATLSAASNDGTDVDVTSLPTTGTYTVFIDPAFGAAATAQLVLNPAATTITVNGAAVNIAATTGGYGKFAGTAGTNLGLGLSGLAFTGGVNGSVTLQVVQPSGGVFATTMCATTNPGAGCDLNLSNLPVTGTYLVQAVSTTATLTNATVTLSSDSVATLTMGTAYTMSLRDGQNGRFSFAGTAGQEATIVFNSLVSNPANQNVALTILKPDATVFWQGTTNTAGNGVVSDLPLMPTTGTYLVFVDPQYGAALSGSVTVNDVQTIALAIDGASAAIGGTKGLYASFQGTAGQNLGLGLSGLTLTGAVGGYVTLTVTRPDGTQLPQTTNCSTGNPGASCALALPNLPLTGAYLVQMINPGYPAVSGGTFTLSSDKTATLTSGTAYALSVRQGQNGRLTFAGTAGQPATIRYENIVTTPANQNVAVTIFNPDGTVLSGPVNGSSTTNGNTLYVASLPSTGTYSVVATPAYGAVTTLLVTLNPASELVIDGAAVNITSQAAGYGTSVSFNATAGQNLGLGLTGLAFSGGAAGYINLYVNKPDGTQLPGVQCSTGNPGGGCNMVLSNLPLTGTYLVYALNPGYPAITGGALTLSSDQTGTLAAGTASPLSLRQGQNGRRTFAGTAGQPAAIRFESVTTTPANQNVAVTIFNPDGSVLSGPVYGSSTTNGNTLYVASLPSTGTYSVVATPAYGAVATLSVTLNPASELVIDGAAVNITSQAAGYGTSVSFNATAGQNLGLGLTGLAFSGGAAGYINLYVNKPDGTQLPGVQCSTGNPGGGCNMVLSNLPLTGTYLVYALNPGYPAITGGALTLSSDQTGTLAAGTASPLSLRQGQNGRRTFAGTAGQPAAIRFENVTTTPANQYVAVTIFNPDGSVLSGPVYGASTTNGNSLYVASLPSTGTYSVVATPAYGAVATLSMTLNPASELVIDGAAVNITSSATGYGTSVSFSATAGQNLGLGLNGVAFNGGVSSYVTLYVNKPDGTELPGVTCWTSNPGSACNMVLSNLPLTGTYLVYVANPGAPAITGGALTLSSDKTATLTSGTAYALSVRQGQNGRLTFTGTAAAHTLTVGVPTTTPAGQTVSVTVLDASSNTVSSGSYSTAAGVLTLGTLSAGTYTVIVTTGYGAATSVTLTYQ